MALQVEATVHELVEMRLDDHRIGFSWVLGNEVEVVLDQLVHIVDFAVIIQSWVLENSLGAHDSITTTEFESVLNVFEVRNTSIQDDWDVECLFDLTNNGVISGSHSYLVVIPCPAVHSQERSPGFLDLLRQVQGILFVW